MKAINDAIRRRLTYAAGGQSETVRFGSDVGFSAEWVCRKQGGERNLGSIAIQAP
jgi:hypothetical protein